MKKLQGVKLIPLAAILLPVSYTHLDVYKRQIDDGAGVWGNYGAGGYDILFKIKRNAVKQKWIPASSEQ